LDQAVERRICPPTLFALCIRAIGKQLKSFCKYVEEVIYGF
jgi:hypothetical protein